jgi:hypothetical protein
MAIASEADPIFMIGVQLHILTEGATYDLRSRIARPRPVEVGQETP